MTDGIYICAGKIENEAKGQTEIKWGKEEITADQAQGKKTDRDLS